MNRPVRLVASLVALVAIPASLAGQTISNPELYGQSARAAMQATAAYGHWDDPEVLKRVSDIGYRLAAHTGFTDFPFSFYLVNMREPNAFALPGGQIFVTRGMIDLGLDDDMLANLLGHEISHVTQKHGVRMQRRATLLNVLSQALLVGVMVAGGADSDRDPRVPYGRTPGGTTSSAAKVQGAAAASIVLGELLLRSYGREFEDESDKEGQRLAAAAGFDPIGAAELFTQMERRLPTSNQYGYWRTHPFNEDRVEAARARGRHLKVQPPSSPDPFRLTTQQVILGYDEGLSKVKEHEERAALELFLDASALTAWPQGPTAEGLRRAYLRRLVDAELEKPELERDFGRVDGAYRRQREQVASLTPDTAFLGELDRQLVEIDGRRDATYPAALEILDGEVYQTPFLELFLSNYPDSDRRPQVAIELARAYSRSRREAEAVEMYLTAYEADPEGELGQRVLRGLRTLTPLVASLSALERLASEVEDPELAEIAATRLASLADSYDELENGAAYLAAYPEGRHARTIEKRLDAIAEAMYGEVLLYQGVGDSMKALDRINRILTHAPLSPAATRIREKAVFS